MLKSDAPIILSDLVAGDGVFSGEGVSMNADGKYIFDPSSSDVKLVILLR